jgi:hypothetical protein
MGRDGFVFWCLESCVEGLDGGGVGGWWVMGDLSGFWWCHG